MSVPFTLELIGGTIEFGFAPLIVIVSLNGGGTSGHLAPWLSPPKPNCTSPVTLDGAGGFIIRGSATTGFGVWDVEFVFPSPPGANLGNLNASPAGVFWELTGEYLMIIKDTTTGEQCEQAAGMSGEYQFVGAALAGWPHNCTTSTQTAGSSPGLIGSMNLRGHGSAFPTFGGPCSPTLAAQANSLIGGRGFISGALDYKLTY
jgi:hypothetical protein